MGGLVFAATADRIRLIIGYGQSWLSARAQEPTWIAAIAISRCDTLDNEDAAGILYIQVTY
jgi:hypothetical protein